MLFDLTGKVAIITGSSHGIGKASAFELAEHGAKVVISSRKQDACDAVAAEINARYGEGTAIAVAANISDKAALQNLVDETRAAFGQIDILVCNAASNPYYGPQADISRRAVPQDPRQQYRVEPLADHDGRARDARAQGRVDHHHLVDRRPARHRPVIGAYCISKAADMQLARNLAHEYGPDNVRVNCIAPGLVKTDFARALWEDPEAPGSGQPRRVPLRRIGEPRGDRGRRGVPRRRGERVHDRADDRDRWRSDDLTPRALTGAAPNVSTRSR